MCMLMLDPPEWIKCYQMLVFFNIWHLMCMLMLDPPERIRMPTISPFDTSCACWCWIHQNESECQPFHHLTPHVHVDAGSTKMNQMLSNASFFSIWHLMCMLMLDPPEWIKCYQMLVFFDIWHLMCMLMLDPPEWIKCYQMLVVFNIWHLMCMCWCWIHQKESECQPFHHLTPHVHVDAGSTRMNQNANHFTIWHLMCMLMLDPPEWIKCYQMLVFFNIWHLMCMLMLDPPEWIKCYQMLVFFNIWHLMCMLMLDPPEWIKCYQMLVFFNIWHLMCMLMLDPLERIRLGACTFLKRNEPGSLPSKFGSRNSPWSLGNFQLCRQGGGHVPQNCFLSACCLAACSSQVIWVGGCIDGVKLWQHWWIWWLAWQYIMSIYEHLWTFWVSMKCQWGCIRRLSKIYESTRCQAVWEIDAQALCFADASLKHNKAPKQVQPSYFPNKYTSIIYTLETIWTGEAADFGCFCTTLHKPISSVSWCS